MQCTDDHPVRFSMRAHPPWAIAGALVAAAVLAGLCGTPRRGNP